MYLSVYVRLLSVSLVSRRSDLAVTRHGTAHAARCRALLRWTRRDSRDRSNQSRVYLTGKKVTVNYVDCGPCADAESQERRTPHRRTATTA